MPSLSRPLLSRSLPDLSELNGAVKRFLILKDFLLPKTDLAVTSSNGLEFPLHLPLTDFHRASDGLKKKNCS